MKYNVIQGVRNLLGLDKVIRNTFNDTFLWGAGGGFTDYDQDASNYINKGYNINPIVYSVINQQATKTASIPFYVKKIDDKKSHNKLLQLKTATGFNPSPRQLIKQLTLENKAYTEDDMPFPMEKPNASQSWAEFIALQKTFLRATGNVYLYMLSPEDGPNAGTPIQMYVLPSHLMQIVVKQDVDLLTNQNPVKEYMLISGKVYSCFKAEDVIHIKFSNPNYSENGEHLYGMAPMRSGAKNIESSNKGLDLNIKTLQNGGAFGLIHGKGAPLQKAQADELKSRLKEMNSNPEDLAKIAGVSAEVGFTRLSLTSDELKPFDYLEFDEKMIHKVLGWAYDDGNRGDYGGTINELRKMRITDNIAPDLQLLSEALNDKFLPRFNGYENTEIVFDVMELPEMQDDLEKLSAWLKDALDRGVISRNEYRVALRYAQSDDVGMDRFTVQNDILGLEEALDNTF